MREALLQARQVGEQWRRAQAFEQAEASLVEGAELLPGGLPALCLDCLPPALPTASPAAPWRTTDSGYVLLQHLGQTRRAVGLPPEQRVNLVRITALSRQVRGRHFLEAVDQLRRAARSEVVGLLQDAALRLEQHRAHVGGYADSEQLVTLLPAGSRYYRLQAQRDEDAFTLLARRVAQTLMADDRCGDFRLDHAVIVGGGVIGLLTALNLAADVDRVVVCDQGEVGRESSWAGGGIVSPLYPWRYSPAVTALAHWSQDFYPQLGERLFASTGIDPQVHTTGLYWLDLDDEAEALAWAAREQRPLSAVDISAVYDACAEDFLPSMVLAKGRYAIPRRDGHILVGSTLEHAGYDKTPTGDALESLKASAVELLPALADAEVYRGMRGCG
ncbi:hypothetical protein WR25_15751 [Diploscapter pachys]|uniref:FAD dependent oxidoreductase domain-containing protein n=1 Tax=Diploscapter pachys TaxID=2018661 RepID=A0A2A2KF48_9BILA|nr:hypothetical protein WR25_15751 [Diploscapter pachys]